MRAALRVCLLIACASGCARTIDAKPGTGAHGSKSMRADAGESGARPIVRSLPPGDGAITSSHVYAIVGAFDPPESTSCFEAGVVAFDAPERISSGFDCNGTNFYTFNIVPHSDELVYNKSQEIWSSEGVWHEWHPDADWSGRVADYPRDPSADDPEFDTPGCPASRFTVMLPDNDGEYFLACSGGLFRSDGTPATTQALPENAGVLALTSSGGVALLRKTSLDYALLDTKMNTLSDVVGLPDGLPTIDGVRALDDGFWVTLEDPLADGQPREAWHIALDASASQIGVYPALADANAVVGRPKLDAQGALYTQTQTEVVQRTIDGDVEVIYDLKEMAPELAAAKGTILTLFTGP